MNPSTLNEIYYKFKKRFLRSQKAKSVYAAPRASLKTDRNLPTLVTSSNVSTPKNNSNINSNVHSNYKPNSTATTSQFVKTSLLLLVIRNKCTLILVCYIVNK